MRKITLLILLLTVYSSIICGQTKKDIIAQQTKAIDSLNLKLSQLTNLFSKTSNELADKNKALKKLEENYRSSTLLISANNEEISTLKNQVVSKEAIIARLKNETASKEKEIVILKNAAIAYEAKIATLVDPNELFFEGSVLMVSIYDGVFYIRVKIDKGELAGKTEDLYYRTGMQDPKSIDCTGNATIDGSGASKGKKISGLIVRSTGDFENYDTGEVDLKEIYRLKEVNYK